jgi:NAD(P)-dependent dehydrogenase (short-subunit alcohol dehydrogenase family)
MDPVSAFRLDGRVVFVSGGGGAIGSALAVGMAEAGARILVADIDRDRVEAAAERVRAAGSEAIAVAGDITNDGDAAGFVARAVEKFGRLDVVVNAVGGGAGKVLFEAQEYPRDAWDWIMELNLRSTLIATQAAVQAMIKAGHGGKVLNISSVRAQLGINAGYSAYVAAKGAISSLTRQWATEWAKYGIRVNAIAPTFVDTPQVASMLADPDFKAGIVNRVPLRRVGETSDLIGPALFFCSDASSFVTGQILTIDGGLTATQ